jgi:SSS family solute:Na+ symporter
MKTSVSRIDLVVVALYLIGVVAAGYWAKRRVTTQEQFLVAGRSVGPWLYSGTLAAIVLGGASTIGTVKLGYQYGISGMWFVFMLGAGILVLSATLVRRILGLNLYTVPELLQRRYSRGARIAGGFVMCAYDLMVGVTSTIAVGAVMEVIVGIPRTPAILISSLIMVLYSVLGGMWSLTLTDIFQFFVKTIGMFFILLPMTLWRVGGIAALHTQLPPQFLSLGNIGLSRIASFFVLYFFGILIGQDIWQRVFTARSVAVARNGGLVVGLYCIAYAIAGALIGTAGRVFLAPVDQPDLTFAIIVNTVLPVGMRGLVLAAALAAIMSTASATLLAAATVLLEDVYLPLRSAASRGSITQSRVITFALGVIMTVLACAMHDVLDALTVAYDLLVGGLLVAVLGAMLWPRSTNFAAVASIFAGGTLVVLFLFISGLTSDLPIYAGLGGSLLVFTGANLASGRDEQ